MGSPDADNGLARDLLALAADPGADRVTVARLVAALGAKGPAALTLLFALPNVVPMPPGTSTVLGLPLLVLTAQLATGRQEVRLPAMLAKWSLPASRLAPVLRRAAAWFEADASPHLGLLVGRSATRVTAGLCVLLALAVLLPIPFSNVVPALAISMCAFGLLRRDGRWVLAGLGVGVASIALIAGVLYAFGRLGLALLAPA